MGAGLVVTVVLDLLLIPRFQEVGAAVASSSAYIATTAVLLLVFWILTRHRQELPVREPVLGEAP
jgi:O-antigen/teichoic acid export membrane protein